MVALHEMDKKKALPIARGMGFNTFLDMKGNQEAITKALELVLAAQAEVKNAASN